MARQTKKARKESTAPLKHVATFGAAVSALVVSHAPTAQAAVINLTPALSSVVNAYGGYGAGANVGLGGAGTFHQFNDTIGKTIGVFTNNFGWRSVNASSVVGSFLYFAGGLNPGNTGTVYVAFKNLANQVGWIKMNLGGEGGNIHYLAGAYNDEPGGSIHVGATNGVPEPAATALMALGLLALGARGVRHLRESRRATPTIDTPAS